VGARGAIRNRRSVSRVQVGARVVVFETRTYTVSPWCRGACRIIAGEITACTLCSGVERMSGRILSPPRLMGTLQALEQLEDAQCSPGRSKIQYLDDQWRPRARGLSNRGDLQLTTHGIEWLDPARRRSTRLT